MTRYKRDFDMKGSGDYVNETAGENLGNHKLVYRGVDGYWYLADADAAATMPVLGITMGAITATRRGEILLDGYIGDNAWTWTGGSEVYASTIAGELTATAPAGAGDIVQVVAIAVDANIIQFTGNVGGGHGGSNTLEGETAFVGFDASKAHFVNYFYCDGTADNVQINDAITYVTTLGGGTIMCEFGAYDIIAQIYVRSNITIDFNNSTLTRTAANIRVMMIENRDNVYIKNAIINGNTTSYASTYSSLVIYSSTGTNGNITLENIISFDSAVHGFHCFSSGDAVFQTNIKVSNCTAYDNTTHGFKFDKVDQLVIENSYSYDNGSDGFTVNRGHNNHFNGNHAYSNTRHGFTIENYSRDCSIVNCSAEENGSRGFVINNSCAFCVIDSCNARDNLVNYNVDTVEGVAATDAYCTVSNNTSYTNGVASTGIYIEKSNYTTVEGNEIYGDYTDSGIIINGEHCNITGNTVDGAVTGIRTSTAGNYSLIKNNIIVNCTTIFTDNATDTAVHEIFCHVKDPDAERTHPVIQLPDGAETTLNDSAYLPLEFQQLVTAQVIILPGASGDMRWNFSSAWGKICASEDYDQHTDTIASTTTAVTVTKLNCIDISAGFTGVAAGDLVGWSFTREGDDVLDTVNDYCDYLGMRIRYV